MFTAVANNSLKRRQLEWPDDESINCIGRNIGTESAKLPADGTPTGKRPKIFAEPTPPSASAAFACDAACTPPFKPLYLPPSNHQAALEHQQTWREQQQEGREPQQQEPQQQERGQHPPAAAAPSFWQQHFVRSGHKAAYQLPPAPAAAHPVPALASRKAQPTLDTMFGRPAATAHSAAAAPAAIAAPAAAAPPPPPQQCHACLTPSAADAAAGIGAARAGHLCAFCERATCGRCMRGCDACGAHLCLLCILADYSQCWDRLVCPACMDVAVSHVIVCILADKLVCSACVDVAGEFIS
ncbi:hypothetical protein JKP88DRAFT_278690 [Tribonema minus]|uniref:Apoptosis regulatory protein Siva n=1 Tax=Tribonema minus TaxID=303371 RepID=A0A835YW00_9STRA|nr:hypothetical protein JKP88DRAFT_278690 [Tribonema minus]